MFKLFFILYIAVWKLKLADRSICAWVCKYCDSTDRHIQYSMVGGRNNVIQYGCSVRSDQNIINSLNNELL